MDDRVIFSSRIFRESREGLFEAFRDPKKLAQWWGPEGFRNTFQEFDLRPGGHWRFVMHGPNGVDYPNESVFEEIVEFERIVFQHRSLPHFQMTIGLSQRSEGTEFSFRMLFETAEECEKVRSLCERANQENFDRLGDLLKK